ncbi:putative protein [Arabidopsis thaliana]|nr:putative protein [Arabidopsis thaliana]CAB79172.1 putative protein [Arabidopsis thaliana]
MERKHNPNSWSDLPHDLLNLVFERLSFANFNRARSVCSSWYSASRQSVPKNQIHWLILFPEDNNNKNNSSCTLFNPDEKDKLYKTQHLDEEFAKSVCRATYGSWFLMVDPLFNLYILNLFTRERINLHPVELLWKDYELGVSSRNRMKSRGGNVRSPVFWIDEITKDYVVLWGLRDWCVFYSKKGDTSWNQIPQTPDCYRLRYKDHKLYFQGYFSSFKIFDLSGEIPQQTFDSLVFVDHCHFRRWVLYSTLVVTLTGKVLNVEKMMDCSFTVFEFTLVNEHHVQVFADTCKYLVFGHRFYRLSDSWVVDETKLVVTVTGNILRVQRMLRPWSGIQSFRVCKVFPKYEEVNSLGDEAMLLDLGITVSANEVEGLRRNSIYFSGIHGEKTNQILIFNIERKNMELLQKLDGSSAHQLSRARWFLPSLTHT